MISQSDLDRFKELRDFFKAKVDETRLESITNSDLQIKVEDFCNGILHVMDEFVFVPAVPSQKIVPNGVLNIPSGTVSLNNDSVQNVIFTDKNGVIASDGWLKELIVINNRVYGTNTISFFVRFSANRGDWQKIDSQIYADLRAGATTIVTTSATYSPDPVNA